MDELTVRIWPRYYNYVKYHNPLFPIQCLGKHFTPYTVDATIIVQHKAYHLVIEKQFLTEQIQLNIEFHHRH